MKNHKKENQIFLMYCSTSTACFYLMLAFTNHALELRDMKDAFYAVLSLITAIPVTLFYSAILDRR